ncbi:hypothetical protein GGR27_001364 [Lewinella antarctica]|uniref:Uncharacterized protein n=1 Tax=Neolewinella antarctica TaxID=442734 RepID=A0ABX0X9Z3_9BACT|nr:hypothetical protein [Neolewinella antarctica]
MAQMMPPVPSILRPQLIQLVVNPRAAVKSNLIFNHTY